MTFDYFMLVLHSLVLEEQHCNSRTAHVSVVFKRTLN